MVRLVETPPISRYNQPRLLNSIALFGNLCDCSMSSIISQHTPLNHVPGHGSLCHVMTCDAYNTVFNYSHRAHIQGISNHSTSLWLMSRLLRLSSTISNSLSRMARSVSPNQVALEPSQAGLLSQNSMETVSEQSIENQG